MDNIRTIFPIGILECSEPAPHSLAMGGLGMKIKNTHPSYTNDEERTQRLRDLKKTCASMVKTAKPEKRAE